MDHVLRQVRESVACVCGEEGKHFFGGIALVLFNANAKRQKVGMVCPRLSVAYFGFVVALFLLLHLSR